MELGFQAVLRPGRLEPELRTHRKDQENAEVIPGSARILRALLVPKPRARWKRALSGKPTAESTFLGFMEPVHVRKASQRAHYEYQHYDLVKRHEFLLIWYNVKTPRLSGNLTRFEEGAAGKYAGRQRKMRSEGASEAMGHVSARRGIQPVTPRSSTGSRGVS